MASEIAQSVHRAYLNGCALVGVIVREDILHGAVDAELAEVREVLGLLSPLRVEGKPCWCESAFRKIGDHDNTCQRTRSLYDKLAIDAHST